MSRCSTYNHHVGSEEEMKPLEFSCSRDEETGASYKESDVDPQSTAIIMGETDAPPPGMKKTKTKKRKKKTNGRKSLSAVVKGVAVAKGEDKNAETRVRVVAPCDLPPNYKLRVTISEEDSNKQRCYAAKGAQQQPSSFDVLVPELGVEENQVFLATKVPVEAIQGRFDDSLWSCGKEPFRWLCMAFCCTGMAFAALLENLQLDFCGAQIPSKMSYTAAKTFAIVVTIWINFCLVPAIDIKLGLAMFLLFIFTNTRMAFRTKYGIPGTCFTDIFVSCCCAPCSALQMYRHMDQSGERPHRFQTPQASAEIV